MLILYQEMFVSSGYLTDDEIWWFFNIPNNSTSDISDGLIMEHWHYEGNDPVSSFVSQLWHLNNYAENIKTGKTIPNASKQFLKNKPINGRYEENWSTSWMHKSSQEDLLLSKQIPVMLSFVYYGKDEKNIVGTTL